MEIRLDETGARPGKEERIALGEQGEEGKEREREKDSERPEELTPYVDHTTERQLEEAEQKTVEEQAPEPAPTNGSPPRNADNIKTLGDLFNACFTDFKLNRGAVMKELALTDANQVRDVKEAYLQVWVAAGQ